MKYLFVKMRRDLTKMWTQFLSVFIMAFLGIFIYVGMEGAWFGMKTEINGYITKTDLASAWVYGNGITNSDLQEIKKTDGVVNCTLAMTLSAKVELPGDIGGKNPDLKLTSCTDTRISTPVTVSGTAYSADGSGIWLDNDFAVANKIKSGDSITISVGDVQKTLSVRGLVISAEYIYYTGSSADSMPNHKQHGFALIGSGTAKDIFDQTVASKMQEKFLPQLNGKISDAYKTAKDTADTKVENGFGKKLSAQKNEAYISAVSTADLLAESAVDSAINKQKQQAYIMAAVQADAAAKQAVDQKFKAMFPSITDFSNLAQYKTALSAQKAQAEAKSKAMVDAQFAARQPQFDAKLAAAKAAAEQKAKDAVDNKFVSMQPVLAEQFATAKKTAENIAKDTATKEILKKCGLTAAQLDIVNQMTSLPKISSLDSSQKADTSRQLVTLLKKLPNSMLSQSVNGFSLSTLNQTPVDYNTIRVKLKDGADSKTLEQKAQDLLDSRYAGFADQDSLPAVSTPIQKTGQIEKMSIMFSVIFILLALLTMQTTMTRLVETQQTQIGTMKALGFKDSQIRLHYVSYGLTVGLLGGLSGLILAPFTISPALLHAQAAIYTLPEWPVSLTPASYAMVAAVVLCCTIATLLACRKGLVGMPAETMRGVAPKAGRQVLLEKLPGLWKHVSFGWKWTIRDISRSKVRSIMGMVGVLGCMMLLIAGFGMQYTDNKSPVYIYNTQYTYASKAVLLSSATQENRSELAKIAGGGQWIQEAEIEYKNASDNSTGVLSILDGDNYVHLNNAEGIAKKLPKSGVVVTQRTARILNLRKGGTVEFRTSGEKSYVRATVSEIVVTPSPQGIFISKSAWQRLGKDFVPTSLLTGNSGTNSKISKLSYVQEVATRQSQLTSAVNNVKTFNFIFLLLKMAAILLDVVILYNLGILSFTERTREYATLKVLGFYQKEIRSFALRENLTTTITGWLIGIPVGLQFLRLYVGAVSSANLDMTPQITPQDFLLATVITVGCSICVNLFLSNRVKKINMVGALKSVE